MSCIDFEITSYQIYDTVIYIYIYIYIYKYIYKEGERGKEEEEVVL